MADVLDWPRDNPAEVAARAGEHLRAGQLVVIPTDTSYAVLAPGQSNTALAQLSQLAQTFGEIPAVALADPLELKDWLPHLESLGAVWPAIAGLAP